MPRTNPPQKEWKILLARSGGVCAFPRCGNRPYLIYRAHSVRNFSVLRLDLLTGT